MQQNSDKTEEGNSKFAQNEQMDSKETSKLYENQRHYRTSAKKLQSPSKVLLADENFALQQELTSKIEVKCPLHKCSSRTNISDRIRAEESGVFSQTVYRKPSPDFPS